MRQAYCKCCLTDKKKDIEIIAKDMNITTSDGTKDNVPVVLFCRNCGNIMTQPEYKTFRLEWLGE